MVVELAFAINNIAAKAINTPASGIFMRIFHLHPRIIRPTAAFGRYPDDILRRVFDVAGFAVDAVLGVDLQAVGVVFVFDVFVDAGGAVAGFGAGVFG